MRSGLINNAMRFLQDLVRSTSTTKPGDTPPKKRSKPTGSNQISFEYSPELDGDPDPGEVVWTWVAYEEDPSQGKDRPVVIVGRRSNLLVGVPLTSKRHDNEAQVLVGTGSWDRQGRPSYAKLERLLDIKPGDVRREGAILDRQRYDEVVAGVRRVHST